MTGHSSRRGALIGLLGVLIPLMYAAAGNADGQVVVFSRYRFNPDLVEIAVGEEVTFLADDGDSLVDSMVPLTIVIEGYVRSPQIRPGERWLVTFTRSGIYDVHLEEHSGVDAVVAVR